MIVFENAGEIDVRSIVTFGVSSKENENAIGFFGTGLKYAIAILLRKNCSITIYSGLNKYEFTSSKQKIRVNDFDIVCMNGEELGFTTELGKTWEVWQAFRELYCNCKDENGTMSYNVVQPRSGRTVIVVSGTAIESVDISSIILTSKPIETVPHLLEVHDGESEYLFYRGVRVLELDKKSKYTYNIITQTDLTEDRTIKYQYSLYSDMAKYVSKLTNTRIIDDIILADEFTYDSEFSFGSVNNYSNEFEERCKYFLRNFSVKINKSIHRIFRNWLIDELSDEAEPVLTPMETKVLQKAIMFNTKIGHKVDTYPIRVADNLGDGVLGRAINGRIYISRRTFMMGTKQVAVTLLEEYLHLKHNLVDCTYEMQNFLFDMIGSMGEELIGEPI